MAAAIPLRDDFDGPALRALAKASKDANQTRRLLCLAVIYEGGRRSEAAALGPTSTVPFKRSFQHNRLCGPRRLLALHFRGFEDQASCSRMLGGRATPAAWKTRPT